MFILMHVTVDDVNFCDGLECAYVKYKSHASAARELHESYMGFSLVKAWLLIECDIAFYAKISIN